MTTHGIIDISNILSSGHHSKRTVKHQLSKVKVGSEEERSKLFNLITWLNSNGDDVMELVKIVMELVNPLETDGSSKKKEARFLYTQVLKLMDVEEDDMSFYLNLFDSGVEVIIWAKKGGLTKVVQHTSGCFPCFKKR